MDKFVFHVPEWQGELLFSKELLVFVGVILLVIVGTLFCFWGYKYFKTILFLGIGIAACYGSYLLVEPLTPKLVIRMFLTVSLTFLGLCFFYFLDIIFSYILDRLRVRDALGKRTYLLAAPLGAAILGLTIYYFIWRDGITAVVISLVCLMVGLPFQHVKRKKQVRFKSYNDLLRLPRPKVDADGLEYIALGTVAAVSAAPAIVAEPAPEPVITAVEPEPEPKLVIEAIEPEPEPELVIETIEPEPEPELVIETIEPKPEPELVIETIEPEPEPELVIETIEPESEPELVIETIEPEPEPGLVIKTIEAEPEPELVIETIESEPEPELIVEAIESEPESDLLVIRLAPEPRVGSELPIELSDSAKELIHKKMESKEDVLEEAFFVKQISELMKAEKRERAAKEMAAKAAAAAAAATAAKAAADAAAAAAVAAAVADAAKAAAAADAAAAAATAAADAAKAVVAVTKMNASLESQTDAAFHHHMEITVTSKHDRKPKSRKKRKKRHA